MKILTLIITLVILGSSDIIAEPYNAAAIRQSEIAQLKRIETQRRITREYNSQKFYNRGMDRLYEQQLRQQPSTNHTPYQYTPESRNVDTGP